MNEEMKSTVNPEEDLESFFNDNEDDELTSDKVECDEAEEETEDSDEICETEDGSDDEATQEETEVSKEDSKNGDDSKEEQADSDEEDSDEEESSQSKEADTEVKVPEFTGTTTEKAIQKLDWEISNTNPFHNDEEKKEKTPYDQMLQMLLPQISNALVDEFKELVKKDEALAEKVLLPHKNLKSCWKKTFTALVEAQVKSGAAKLTLENGMSGYAGVGDSDDFCKLMKAYYDIDDKEYIEEQKKKKAKEEADKKKREAEKKKKASKSSSKTATTAKKKETSEAKSKTEDFMFSLFD